MISLRAIHQHRRVVAVFHCIGFSLRVSLVRDLITNSSLPRTYAASRQQYIFGNAYARSRTPLSSWRSIRCAVADLLCSRVLQVMGGDPIISCGCDCEAAFKFKALQLDTRKPRGGSVFRALFAIFCEISIYRRKERCFREVYFCSSLSRSFFDQRNRLT